MAAAFLFVLADGLLMNASTTTYRLFQRSADVCGALSIAAFAFLGVAISMLAIGWGGSFAPILRPAILAGVAAAALQSLAGIGYTWCMILRMTVGQNAQIELLPSKNRMFLASLISWVSLGALQLALAAMPFALIKPWLFGLLLGVATAHALGIRLTREWARSACQRHLTESSGSLSA